MVRKPAPFGRRAWGRTSPDMLEGLLRLDAYVRHFPENTYPCELQRRENCPTPDQAHPPDAPPAGRVEPSPTREVEPPPREAWCLSPVIGSFAAASMAVSRHRNVVAITIALRAGRVFPSIAGESVGRDSLRSE